MSSSTRKIDACLLMLALGLASCTRPPDTDASAQEAAAHEPAWDQADEHQHAAEADDEGGVIPPATVPHAASALVPLATSFDGFGPVPFGATADELRQAWRGQLEGQPDANDPQACYYLFPQPRPEQGHGTAFMIEGGHFVRVDVDQSGAVAPGGGRIGMDAAEIQALYPGQVEERPHKYVEGALYLRVVPDDSPSVLVFEVSPEGKVQRWRVGVPPQADYVEGCS